MVMTVRAKMAAVLALRRQSRIPPSSWGRMTKAYRIVLLEAAGLRRAQCGANSPPTSVSEAAGPTAHHGLASFISTMMTCVGVVPTFSPIWDSPFE